MSDVHLHVLLDDFVEVGLGHLPNRLKRLGEVDGGREAESALGDVDRAHFTGEIVHVLEQVSVDLREPVEGSDFESAKQLIVIELKGPALG